MTDLIASGTLAGPGTYRCDGCGYELTLPDRRALDPCPSCGMGLYERIPAHLRNVAGDRPPQNR